MSRVWAILWKQIKDTLKNKETLIQFIMFPAITIVMEKAIHVEGMPERYFANLFAVMYIGMAPLTSIAAIIAEEKEKNTLRVLRLSNVKAMEYLLGNAIYIWSVCMIGSLIIGVAGGYTGATLLAFMGIMALGHICSMLVGAAIGVISKSQMQATSLTVPVMLVFAFLPMLSAFNEGIEKVAKFIFSQQFYMMINNLPEVEITLESGLILGGNAVLILAMFLWAYKREF